MTKRMNEVCKGETIKVEYGAFGNYLTGVVVDITPDGKGWLRVVLDINGNTTAMCADYNERVRVA